jgi:hypothetical protein
VDWEQRFIGWSNSRNLRMAAMLTQTGQGRRTLSGKTRNFPQRDLELELPANAPFQPDQKLIVSLLPTSLPDECVLGARVLEYNLDMLRVRVDDRFERRYARLVRQLRQPPAAWPAWLPGPLVQEGFKAQFARLAHSLAGVLRVSWIRGSRMTGRNV